MEITFPVSGVEAPFWLPTVVAFCVSYFTSMAGVSGAFLLMPFQVSVLNFTTPSVSPTNLVFNITGIPGGVYRYLRERRLVWPLTLLVVAGTLPGVIGGVYLRLTFMSNPSMFKAFVGLVLMYIGVRLLFEVKGSGVHTGSDNVEIIRFSMGELVFAFGGEEHRCRTIGILLLSVGVGVLGGAYGIGGGAVIAPIFVAFYRFPVHAVAGATLMGTMTTSIIGIFVYRFAHLFVPGIDRPVSPDWALGLLFGLGGLAGMYLGARTQRLIHSRWIKLLLAMIVLFVAVRYILGYLWNSW